jgi:hypothetical protein
MITREVGDKLVPWGSRAFSALEETSDVIVPC